MASAPSGTPAPAPTGVLTAGFKYGDILKVNVNNLAAREAPNRTAALVHGYNLSGPAPIDDGLVRLDKGDFVSVHLGPLKIGNTVWYLVWPSDDAKFNQSAIDWYSGPPATTAAGPAWVAASVGPDSYMALERSPSVEQLEQFLPIGVNLAGTGPWDSAPQPRHDFNQFDWAVAAPSQGTSCNLQVKLVPADPTWAPKVGLTTSTDASKVASLDGEAVSAPWLPIPEGQWTTFTVQVSGTCRWAIRLTPLHHD